MKWKYSRNPLRGQTPTLRFYIRSGFCKHSSKITHRHTFSLQCLASLRLHAAPDFCAPGSKVAPAPGLWASAYVGHVDSTAQDSSKVSVSSLSLWDPAFPECLVHTFSAVIKINKGQFSWWLLIFSLWNVQLWPFVTMFLWALITSSLKGFLLLDLF